MNDIIITFNGMNYKAKYNEQTDYYELDIIAPDIGGVYDLDIKFIDPFEVINESNLKVQVLEKEKIKIDSNKFFAWFFDVDDFTVKDIIEIPEYSLTIDEETNKSSTINVLSKTNVKSGDIVVIKQNNEAIYWGIVDNIQNENGEKKYIYVLKYITNLFDEKVELNFENIIRNAGIEDFLKKQLDENFILSSDSFLNKKYLEVVTKSHTPLNVSVTNVDNGLFNLHTYMTNCTQNYNIVYNFKIEGKKIIIEIVKKEMKQELIDTKASRITNYNEVFETDVISRVIVKTSTNEKYSLYLLNDRTTTTDSNDINRAKGKTERVYTEKIEDARQTALDVFKKNSYKHMITFKLNRYIPVGTPIAIKTDNNVILDTYISSILINNANFFGYTCGNIRMNFIDKLLKERGN